MNKKGLLAGALVVVSVAAISIGSTFALLKDKTATKANVFTATAGLTGQIKEDLFDGLDYDGTQVDPQPEKLGKDLALNVVPGPCDSQGPSGEEHLRYRCRLDRREAGCQL